MNALYGTASYTVDAVRPAMVFDLGNIFCV